MNARVDPSDFDVGTPAAEGSPAAPAPAEEALKVPPKSEKLDDVETPAQHRRHRPRKRVIIPLVLATLASGAGWFGWHWWTQTRFIESTDDAYFKANIVALAPRVAGTVVSVKVGDNEKVKAGQVLLRIDDSTYRADERQAEANLAGAKAALTHLAARRALQRLKIEEAQANLNAAQSQLTLARANNARSQRLFKDGFTAKSKLDATRAALKAASAVHAKAAAALASARQQLKVLASEQQQLSARRDRAAAAARVAELNLAHTVVRAPRDGVVGNKGVRVGEYVHIGQTLMSLARISHAILA